MYIEETCSEISKSAVPIPEFGTAGRNRGINQSDKFYIPVPNSVFGTGKVVLRRSTLRNIQIAVPNTEFGTANESVLF